MRSLSTVLTLSLVAAFLAIATSAPSPPAQSTSQKDRLKTCAAEAKAKKLSGSGAKTFIDACVSDEAEKQAQTAPPRPTPLQRFRTCRITAEGQKLSGSARDQFVSNCFKEASSPQTAR
jgi:hypothetical protein